MPKTTENIKTNSKVQERSTGGFIYWGMCLFVRSKIKRVITSFGHLLFVDVMLFTSCFPRICAKFTTTVEWTSKKAFVCLSNTLTAVCPPGFGPDRLNSTLKNFRGIQGRTGIVFSKRETDTFLSFFLYRQINLILLQYNLKFHIFSVFLS